MSDLAPHMKKRLEQLVEEFRSKGKSEEWIKGFVRGFTKKPHSSVRRVHEEGKEES